jgi:hypothetical protein
MRERPQVADVLMDPRGMAGGTPAHNMAAGGAGGVEAGGVVQPTNASLAVFSGFRAGRACISNSNT